MTPGEKATFERIFGFPVPPALEKLLGDDSLRKSVPVRYRFTSVCFVLEIQYLLNLEDSENYDVENKRLAFAVNTDGNVQIVDLSTDEFRIMQNEQGDLDYLGITIHDLLNASRSSL